MFINYNLNPCTTKNLYYCGGFFVRKCKKRRYMSYIAAFFGTAAVHRVYCGGFWDHCYRYGFLQCPTVAGHKTAAIYMF